MFKWEKEDDPLRDHAKSNPDCEFIRTFYMQPQREGEDKSMLIEAMCEESKGEEKKRKIVEKAKKQKDFAVSLLLSSFT